MSTNPDRIFLLHITDLHFGENKDNEYWDEVNDKLQAFYILLAKLRQSYPKVKIHIAITGDFIDGRVYIAPVDKEHISKAENAFHQFLLDISAKLSTEKEPFDHNAFIFCLGNHDRNRNEFETILERLKSEGIKTFFCTYKDLARSEKNNFRKNTNREEYDKRVIDAQIESRNDSPPFLNPYRSIDQCEEPKFRGESNFLLGEKILDGIQYLVFNSSWLCGEDRKDATGKIIPEDGDLTLGQEVALELLEESKVNRQRCLYSIGLMHHNFSSMHNSNYLPSIDGQALSTKIFDGCSVLLLGHEHGEVPILIGDAKTYILRAGTFLSKGDLKGYNSFGLITIDFETEKIEKQTYRYEDKTKEWKFYPEYDFTLDFPDTIRRKIIGSKLEINDYFTIQKKRVFNYINNSLLIVLDAEAVLSSTFTVEQMVGKYICDLSSLKESDTLSGYIKSHTLRRARVLMKLKRMGIEATAFLEPLELMNTS